MVFFQNARNILITGGQFINVEHNVEYQGLNGLQILSQNITHGATHDSAERYPPPKCYPNTRRAIVNNILQWTRSTLQETDESRLFWMNGPAGVGKTAIAQTVCELLQESDQSSGSFFFSRTVPGRNDPKSLFSTIAYQLAIAVPDTFGQAIEEKIKAGPSILEKNMKLQLEKLVIEPLRLLDPTMSPLVIVIDGLDECQGETSQGEIVRLLGSLSRHGNLPIKIILTSRPEPWICHEFEDPLLSTHTRLFLEQTSETDEDIRTFLRSGFSDICGSPDHRSTMADMPKPWPADSAVEDLVERASGQFIYPSTVLKFVGDPFKLPADQLNLILSTARASNNTSTCNPFADLDQLYIQILSTSPDKQQTLDVLGAILTLMDVQYEEFFEGYVKQLLDLPPEKALRSVRSLADVSQDGHVKFFHKSFPDFLLDASRSDGYFIDINVMHNRMAVACLKLIRRRHWQHTNGATAAAAVGSSFLGCPLDAISNVPPEPTW
ncbi:hypothetical protein BDZ97DRAFT_1923620 [Flammula alnicola]|nr:hypothetical protein BDZ97DRAFT_1923620 [Flammula alnicola]